jgi:hypothetical protein
MRHGGVSIEANATNIYFPPTKTFTSSRQTERTGNTCEYKFCTYIYGNGLGVLAVGQRFSPLTDIPLLLISSKLGDQKSKLTDLRFPSNQRKQIKELVI